MKRVDVPRALFVAAFILMLSIPPLGTVAGTPVTIAGRVWDDVDHDGVREGGEAGLVAQIQLLDPDGQVIQTVTSSLPDGQYALSVPSAGDHRVKVVLQANQKASRKDSSVVGDRFDSDIDAAGITDPIAIGTDDVSRVDAGLILADARGMLYLERNGMRDWSEGDRLLAGWKVRLVPAVNRATIITEVVTDEDGEFRILIPASRMLNELMVQVVLPKTYGPIDPERDDIDKDGYVRPFFAGQGLDLEIAIHRPVRVGDRVWRDKNLNGRQDPGEPGVAGIEVQLMDPEMERSFAKVETDARGRFKLIAPAPGSYRIVVKMPLSGGQWSPMRKDLPEGIDSDVRPGGADPGTSPILVLKAGQDRTDLDVGMRFR